MKILKTASGNKLSISRKEWEAMGIKSGWLTSRYRGPGKGTSEKEVTLYRDSNGTISLMEDEGTPFTAFIEYSYSPAEKAEYEGSLMTYPGASASVDIISVKDENGNEVPVDHESLSETFDLVNEYENVSESAYENAMDAKREDKILGSY
ncbi:MAG: hypothetical protein WC119_01045 [Synergistaceae bacterium]